MYQCRLKERTESPFIRIFAALTPILAQGIQTISFAHGENNVPIMSFIVVVDGFPMSFAFIVNEPAEQVRRATAALVSEFDRPLGEAFVMLPRRPRPRPLAVACWSKYYYCGRVNNDLSRNNPSAANIPPLVQSTYST